MGVPGLVILTACSNERLAWLPALLSAAGFVPEPAQDWFKAFSYKIRRFFRNYLLKRTQKRINNISSLDFLSTNCCPSHCAFVSRLCDYSLSSLQQNACVTDAVHGTSTDDYSFTNHNRQPLVETRDFLYSNHTDRPQAQLVPCVIDTGSFLGG